MHCPFCSAEDTKVIDSRLVAEGDQVRRRRECLSCKERYTTYEVAELVMPRSSMMKERNLQGNRLTLWPVFVPLLEADKIINLPIAKHHSLSGLSLGMKNWIGAVGGRRNALHQDIHQVIVDMAQYFKPTLTLIDAIRIMVRNGPSGGRASDVEVKNQLILSDDQVAADSTQCWPLSSHRFRAKSGQSDQ